MGREYSKSGYWRVIWVVVLLAAIYLVSNTEGSAMDVQQRMQKLENRVEVINRANFNCQTQCKNLDDKCTAQAFKEASDFAQAQAANEALGIELRSLKYRVTVNEGELRDCKGRVVILESRLSDACKKIFQLESIRQQSGNNNGKNTVQVNRTVVQVVQTRG